MKRLSTKKSLITAVTVTGLIISTISPANNSRAEYEKGVQAGIAAALSANLQIQTATVEEHEVALSAAPKEEINPELLGEDKDGNQTICGYVNLGIVKVKGNLNIRKTPSKKGRIVGKITNKAGCEVIKEKDKWVKIKSGKVKGWVSREYLLTEEDALAVVNKAASHVAKVTTNNLRVRKKASTKAKVITTVAKGEKLEVIEEKEDWIKVEINGDEGYISSDYAKTFYALDEASTLAAVSGGANGVSDTRVSLVQYALQFVGGRYVWGGTSLTNGVDCSGFTMQIFAKYGYSLPHHSGSQASHGTSISASEAKPGDLFFYGSGGRIGHVAIYIGNGQIVHAQSARTGIVISNAFYSSPIKVVRILN